MLPPFLLSAHKNFSDFSDVLLLWKEGERRLLYVWAAQKHASLATTYHMLFHIDQLATPSDRLHWPSPLHFTADVSWFYSYSPLQSHTPKVGSILGCGIKATI
eukprot:960520-Prorocentrum_minimum.AAC.1